MRLKTFGWVLLWTLALTLMPLSGQAQDAGQCSALVEKAIQALGPNCDGLDRNSACYGFDQVSATFFQDVPDDAFAKPSDKTPLTELQTIATTPLDEALQRWGIALLRVQANVPRSLPGQAVVFMLLGGTNAENAVKPADALASNVSVKVETTDKANVRSGPSTRNNVLGAVDAGTPLDADGVNDGRDWLRVLYKDGPAWLNAGTVKTGDDLSKLPVITPDTKSPMQAFYFKTKFNESDCVQAPDALLIQGPKSMKVNLLANQATVNIGSTILLKQSNDTTMELIVIDGEAQVNNLLIPTGWKAFAPLTPPDDKTKNNLSLEDPKVIGGPWKECTPLTPEEIAALKGLQGIPASLLNYPIVVPDAAEGKCGPPLSTPPKGNTGGGSNAAGGGCATVIDGPAKGQADCCKLRTLSPVGSVPYGDVTFSWGAVPGATQYKLNFFAQDGSYLTSYLTKGAETSMNVFTPGLTNGSIFTWEVEALVGGANACTSIPRTGITRDPETPGDSMSGGGDNNPMTTRTPPPVCGNGICEPPKENTRTCPRDCP
jgi:hypothetical protein